jgi:hypothetical protein
MKRMPRVIWMLALCASAGAQISFSEKPKPKGGPKAEVVWFDKVWDRAPHSAFTDLVRYRERWYLAFREAATHVSQDGAIRILSSQDFERWESIAQLTYPVADLRDPKLAVTPDNMLMLTTAGHMHPPSDNNFKTFAWHSRDGRDWTSAEVIGDLEVWLWRVQWHNGRAYSMGYSTTGTRFLRSYVSTDGRNFGVLNPVIQDQEYPNETSLVFLPNDTALCLLRRDEGSKTALLGRSVPPYRGWTWQNLGVRIGGPHMIRIPDGRLIAAVRLYDGGTRTALCWLDPVAGELKEFLALPSGGDTSYAGLVWHDDLLHVSYYSSHEGRASIYLAKVRIPR